MRKFHDINVSRTLVALRSLELVTLAEVKNHLKETAGDAATDNYINAVIKAARLTTEGYCNRSFALQDWILSMDRLPSGRNEVYIPRSPVLEITSFSYIDTAGDVQSLDPADYILDANSLPGRIVPALNEVWPETACIPGAVTIEYTAGIDGTGDAPEIDISANVPADVKHAQYLLIQHLYDQRAPLNIGNTVNELPWSIEALLEPYRIAGV